MYTRLHMHTHLYTYPYTDRLCGKNLQFTTSFKHGIMKALWAYRGGKKHRLLGIKKSFPAKWKQNFEKGGGAGQYSQYGKKINLKAWTIFHFIKLETWPLALPDMTCVHFSAAHHHHTKTAVNGCCHQGLNLLLPPSHTNLALKPTTSAFSRKWGGSELNNSFEPGSRAWVTWQLLALFSKGSVRLLFFFPSCWLERNHDASSRISHLRLWSTLEKEHAQCSNHKGSTWDNENLQQSHQFNPGLLNSGFWNRGRINFYLVQIVILRFHYL